MTNRGIRDLAAFFVMLFVVLVIRQAYVQLVIASSIAERPGNPRQALLDANRGRIVASDGTVLAQTQGGKREYPLGAQTAAVVGYVSQRYGTSGIEEAFDRALAPDSSGDPLAQLAQIAGALRGSTDVEAGADVVTTIVPAVQEELYSLLSRYDRAAGVVLDPQTGAVLALGSVPSYDPNDLDAEFGALRDDSRAPLLDRALDGLYPPGSTFKIFTASAALDAGTVTLDSRFEDPGYLQIGDFTLHDNESEATGDADLTRAFALSSNVDFAQIALKMGVDTFYAYLDRWGIGSPLDFQLPAEPARIPAKAGIVPGELAQMGFGQGALLVSPLQMALIGATIANAGQEPRPYVVRQVVRDGIPASVSVTATLANPVSSDTAAKVTNMMIAVVERGTGTPAQLPHVLVAGKTGTATNPLGRSHAWFVAFAPAQHPRVAVAIVVENVGYGATYAAPIARDVLKAALGNAGELIEERIFNNRYRLDRKLGEGGMAIVYCGTDILLRRRVAIKVLREQYAADAEFVRRFYQEAESAAKLSHPNIVNTFDMGHEGETYFIVMELVDGPSLAEIIAADGCLPEPVAIDYAAQIASGLAYAHRQGILHRDIKPANILVTKDDVVKLSDFGIARAVSQQTMALTKPGLVMGSVYYISPEQAQEHELHETSDLYSMGIVLYQMLTGKLPYTGESAVTVALKHIGDPVPVIDVGSSGISPALAAIVNRLLQKNPQRRFQSASELATALREARERPSIASYRIADDAPGHPRSARGSLPPRRSPMPDRPYLSQDEEEPQRSARGAWIAAVLLLALIGATGLGYFLFARPLPSFGAGVVVQDYTGMTQAQAQQAVVNAGLRTRFTKSASETVKPDHVIRQSPPAGTKVEKNQVVELVISNGKPLLGLDDVRGYNANDAARTLQQDGFAVTLVRRFDNTIKDNVLDQTPKPGAKVPEGSRITLVVSDGPAPVVVPNFVGMKVESAQSRASALGITLDTSQSVAGMPPDSVASQSIAAGTKLDRNATVHVVVNNGIPLNTAPPAGTGPLANLPSVAGLEYGAAIAALTTAGFQYRVRYVQQSTNNGTVVAQDPPPGSSPQGTTVEVTLSVPGEVPDTNGMNRTEALKTLSDAGYSVGKWEYTTIGADGKVVGTDPAAGTALAPGSSVGVTVNGTPPP